MASKLPTKNIVSFIELKKRCPKNQLHHLENFFAKHQYYQSELKSLKKDPPIIDWDYYKRNVRSEYRQMVEEFEQKYESFTVPYPNDNYTKQIDICKDKLKTEIAEFNAKSNERIAGYEKEMERIRSLLPFDQMTWEDYCIMYPDDAPDFINRPTFWPHDKEEQLVKENNQEDDECQPK